MKHLKKVLLILVTVMLGACCLGLAACGEKAPEAVNVNSIKFDGSAFTWDAVEGATMYIVDVDGVQKNEYTNKHTASIGKDVNELTIKIIAKNDVGQSDEVGKFFTRLETIDSKSFTFDNEGVLSWTGVSGATGYVIRINGNDKLVGDVTSFSEFEYGSVNEIKVRATGVDGTFSTFSDSVKKRYLGIPSNVKYNGTDITWTGDANGKGYIVYIDGNPQQTETNLLKNTKYSPDVDASFTIEIACIGDGKDAFTSKKSEVISCSKLDDVRNLRVEEGILKWDEVDGANGYFVQVGNATEVKVDGCEYDGISAGSEHEVKVKPYSDAEYCFAKYCNVVKILIIESPDLHWEAGTSGEGTKSLRWNSVTGAQGYNVRVTSPNGNVNDNIVNLLDTTFAYDYSEVGEYKIEVCATTTKSNHYNSKWSTPYTVRRLAAPEIAADGITSDANNFNDGFTVNFSSVTGGDMYQVYYGNSVISNPATTLSRKITVTYDSSKTEMVYSVQAVGSSDDNHKIAKLDSPKKEFRIIVLTTPTDLTVADDTSNIDKKGVFTWNGSASDYAVKVGGAIQSASDNRYEFVNLPEGESKVTVCAKGNGGTTLASPYAGEITVYKLSVPTGIEVNTSEDEGKLKFNLPTGAASAIIYINGNKVGVNSNSAPNLNDSAFNRTDGIAVIMRAIGTGKPDGQGRFVISSEPTETKTFYKLAKVNKDSFSIDGYTLKWGNPSNVSNTELGNVYYEIYDADGNTMNLKPSSPELLMSDESQFPCGKSYTFQIRCKSNNGGKYFNSDYSDSITVTKLAKPTLSVNADKNGYAWNGVASATGYTVTVDKQTFGGGDYIHNGVGTYNLPSDKFLSFFGSEKLYTVSIVALGNANDFIMNSNAYELSQNVKKLQTPVVSVSYSEERVSTTGYLTATVDGVDYANGYSFYFNDLAQSASTENAKICTYNPNRGTGNIVVYAVANGGLFDDEGNCYIESNNSTSASILLNAAVTSSTILKSDIDKQITWTNIDNFNGNLGYTVEIEYSDTNGSPKKYTNNKVTENSIRYSSNIIPDLQSVISVTIWANGNSDGTVIAADKTTKRWS